MPRSVAVELDYRERPTRERAGALPLPHPSVDERAIERRARRVNASAAKRVLDITIAAIAILLLVPTFLAVACLIKAESRGPVFFRQRRYGVNQRPFAIFKFRSMTVLESEGPFRQAVANDLRVTRVGRFLRRSSLDEMPQLINVLLGDMSLVGPRPHATVMDDAFTESIRHYQDRFLVRPGLTGLAQVAGYRGPTDTEDKIVGRIIRDRAYIRHWSPLMDIAIIMRTPICLVRDPNAL